MLSFLLVLYSTAIVSFFCPFRNKKMGLSAALVGERRLGSQGAAELPYDCQLVAKIIRTSTAKQMSHVMMARRVALWAFSLSHHHSGRTP